ncbi:hypothetical protein UlMin_002249 [Ulmus minor]
MTGCNKPLRKDQASIKYGWNPARHSSSELADFAHVEYSSTLSDNIDKQSSKRCDSKTTAVLSTAELIQAVGQIWDYASRPFASFQNEATSSHNDRERHKEVILNSLQGKGNGGVPSSAKSNHLCVDLKNVHASSPQLQPNLDFVKVTQKMSLSEPLSENNTPSSFWRLLQGGANMCKEPWRGQGLATVEISYELENIYGWMKPTNFSGSKHPLKVTEVENRASEYRIPGDAVSVAGGCILGETTCPENKVAALSADSNPLLSKPFNLASSDNMKSDMTTRSSLYADYFLSHVLENSVTMTSCSNLYADYYINSLASYNGAFDECRLITDNDKMPENKRKLFQELGNEGSFKVTSAVQKPNFIRPLIKQEHAFAGAFAGIIVSLCLHPVDTIKTVVQSCRAEQKSLSYIGKSIVSDRGLTGLYRGLATNIASSAPISAIYTFTYESVKGALLPLFPKEYCYFAHCVAGGCASIATSFVFTPSERIKQQMQVGSHYHNCWNALIGIIRKGGLPSLYAGWGAVLCRNVPHSIIKFYTYESLKQLTSSSITSSIQPNPLQTLVCGGLAASTAAFFTTPFDVVKTRLQTQIPGSTSQYSSVIHALREIGKQEGLKGLYRGLTPRLVMYMTQGALFFASYEFFKRFFSLDKPQPDTERIRYQQNAEKDSSMSPSSQTPSVSSSSASPRLHNLHSP